MFSLVISKPVPKKLLMSRLKHKYIQESFHQSKGITDITNSTVTTVLWLQAISVSA